MDRRAQMINWLGMYTLFIKEVWRFLKVTIQTILTPVVTSLLYLLVFGQALEEHVEVFDGVNYLHFLIPGLMMMNIITNSFANSSSSLIQSKMNGNLIFVLLAPLSVLEIFLAFTAAALLRGIMVGFVVYLAVSPFIQLPIHSPMMVVAFALLGSASLGAMGIIGGIWAENYDQHAGFQNFIILPLSFLSGVFYSLNSLPELWQTVSHFNPFFYMVDGFRYGFFGQSDADPQLNLLICSLFLLFLAFISLSMLHKGYKIRR
ncbi:MAG: ABC transporter permease [Gammaproteobacteria bacterium]|nr:ABC transporter permease [Gammaproteobacteria bacterium]